MDSVNAFKKILEIGKEVEEIEDKIDKLNEISGELIDNPPKETEYLFHDWNKESALKILLHFIDSNGLNKELIKIVDCLDYRSQD